VSRRQQKVNIAITPKISRRGVLTISLDDDPWRDVHVTIFGYKLEITANFQTKEELEQKFVDLEYKCAKRYVLKRLSEKSLHSSELASALKLRLVTENNIKKIIVECKELGYLKDRDWIESFIRCQTSRRQGPQTIAMKLRKKGINEADFIELIEKRANTECQQSSINHLLTTKYRLKNLKDYRERQKVISSLLRRGFELNVIISSIKIGNNVTDINYFDENNARDW
jgi:regulatory protein